MHPSSHSSPDGDQLAGVPTIAGFQIALEGLLIKRARLRSEYYDTIGEPSAFLDEFSKSGIRADVFSFLENVSDPTPRHPYFHDTESIAVLQLTTFDNWWKGQINDKIRNMARKAGKKGVEIRVVPFDDTLVRGIKAIYDETPVRQGRKFTHYGKDLNTVKADHVTYLSRSEFIGAFFGQELIGFIKLVHNPHASNLMQIIAKISERDKAPIDALLAKAVELCTLRGVGRLQYGSWSRKGLGEYKVHRGFVRLEIPRYHVPLSATGRLAIKLRLHKHWSKYVPESVWDKLAEARNKWSSRRA